MATLRFRRLDGQSAIGWSMVVVLCVLLALGLGAALYMEEHGHVVTGMNNQIVWGLPHVFAVFLIVAASGALNLASLSSVFNRSVYKPYARLSGLLAVSLLAGGLAVLVLDLGRPERLVVAMTNYNFRSIFAWNIFLYTGFAAIVGVYLYAMMDRVLAKNALMVKSVGMLAFVWRLVLTTGTGSIFGFLAARQAIHGAIMAPLFIAASFLYGLAFTLVVMAVVDRRLLTTEIAERFRGLLGIFALSVLYFTIVHHLTKFYGAGDADVEWFLLRDGGVYTAVFWIGQILCGTLLPLALLAVWRSCGAGRGLLILASLLFLLGGLAQLYVIIIASQAYPLQLFPGVAVSSAFFDGVVTHYHPSMPELALGVGGVALALLVMTLALRLLPFLPLNETAEEGA